VAGIIGWVGLVVPHAARILVGADFRRVLPASAAIGACYLMAIDDIARAATTAELPLGVLTALVGAPIFALLLRCQRRRENASAWRSKNASGPNARRPPRGPSGVRA
jgi:iron complex transport system permease protein